MLRRGHSGNTCAPRMSVVRRIQWGTRCQSGKNKARLPGPRVGKAVSVADVAVVEGSAAEVDVKEVAAEPVEQMEVLSPNISPNQT